MLFSNAKLRYSPIMKRLSLLLVATLLAACSPNAPKAENTSSARQISALPLTIRTTDGSHRFTVEVALTERQQERGLMFRNRSLLTLACCSRWTHRVPPASG